MAEQSSIEWTDATWNPVRGCTKISPGCKNCYAERFAERFRGVRGHSFEFGFDLRLVPDKLDLPLRWKTPKRIFVNSMSDLFHEAVPDAYVMAVAETMLLANWHVFQVLTKRAERLRTSLHTNLHAVSAAHHIWWGVSVENRKVWYSTLEGAAASKRGGAVSIDRTVARRPRRIESGGYFMGNRWRRIRPTRTSDARALGRKYPRAM